MIRLINSIRRDERGAAIIELAMAAPVLALMTIGIVDMSNAFGRKLALEQAAQRAIEKVMQTTEDDTVESVIVSEAATQGNVPTDNVEVEYILECDGSKQSDPEGNCPSGQREARYLTVEVTDTYTPMFPVHFAGIKSDGKYHISATAGMRTQ